MYYCTLFYPDAYTSVYTSKFLLPEYLEGRDTFVLSRFYKEPLLFYGLILLLSHRLNR